MLYRVLYSPGFNKIYRNALKVLAPNWKWKSKIPVSGQLRINTGQGDLKILTNPTSFAAKQIFWDGMDAFEYVPIFKDFIQKVDSFVDIGANTGFYSTLGCLYNKSLKVIAFEPSKGPFEYLNRNIKANGFSDRIIPYQIAAASEKGTADFFEVAHNKYYFLEHNLGGVGNLGGKISHREMETNQVETDTLDNILQSQHPSFSPQLIKIDTEATEDIVLRGMDETLEKYRPIVICETLFNRIEAQIEEVFIGRNYEFYNHIQHTNKLQRVDSIQRSDDNGVRDCFIVPVEKKELIKAYL